MSEAERTPEVLRVGIMCHGTTFALSQAESIRQVLRVRGVKLALLIIDDTAAPIGNEMGWGGRLSRFGARLRRYLGSNSLWFMYVRLAYALSPSMPHRVLVDLAKYLDTVPAIRSRPESRGRYSQYFTEEDIRTIRGYGLDVILRFGFGIIRGEILDSARYGVWSYHHGDHLTYRGGPPGFWEVYHADSVSGAILQRLTHRLDDGIIIHKEQFNTILHSYPQNLNRLLMGTTDWMANACRALIVGGPGGIFLASESSRAPIYRVPNNRQMLVFLYRLVKRNLWKQIKELFLEPKIRVINWAVGIVRSPAAALLQQREFPAVQWLEPPEGRFFADPFVIVRDGVTYIFLEDYDNRKQKGRISVVETSDLQTFSEVKPVLELPFHLSYPYVIEYEGRCFMVPEQAQSGRVDLYEAEIFPDRWVKRSTLIHDFHGIDPTLIQHEGHWWMFLGDDENDEATNLYVFHANDLLGPWRPHEKNPVRQELGVTRPGGTPFHVGNRLVRPTQDGSKSYSVSLILNEIKVLTESEYDEEFFAELRPSSQWPYPQGVHTLTVADGITFIDGLRYSLVPSSFAQVSTTKVRYLFSILARLHRRG